MSGPAFSSVPARGRRWWRGLRWDVVWLVAVVLVIAGCSGETPEPASASSHVVLSVNGSDGGRHISWSVTNEPAGSVFEVVGPVKPWTFEFRWDRLDRPRTVRVSVTNGTGWVACSITVDDEQKAAQREDSPYGEATCETRVG